MNTISAVKADALRRLFTDGASIREAMRETGVGKHTALRYKRMVCHGDLPVMPPPNGGAGGAMGGDYCKQTPQSERMALWEKCCGPIPEGQRLGWKCPIHYCGYLEHMCLVEDRTAGWNKWRGLVDYDAVASLPVGGYFEFSRPATEELTNKLRACVAQRIRVPYAIRTSKDGATCRIYRIADGWTLGRRGEEANLLADSLAVEWNPKAVSPEERERRKIQYELEKQERCRQRIMRVFSRHIRLGAPSIWLGQFRLSEQDQTFLTLPRRRLCTEQGCVFPAQRGKTLCHRHEHFYDYKWSMEWRALGYADTHSTEETPVPLLSTMQGWELRYSAERTVFVHDAGTAKREKLSDDWWRENVEKYMATLPKSSAHIRVTRAVSPQYMPEDKTVNIQHTGAFVLWKGFGKKKIRKSQRKRPAGWHGNHPEQKPREKWGKREALDDVPMWAPQGRDSETQEFRDDEECEYTPLSLDSGQEQTEDFG